MAETPTEQEMSFYERICDSKVIHEESLAGCKKTVIRTHSGATVVMTQPCHTEEELHQIGADFAAAAHRLLFPEEDISRYSAIKVVR